MSVTVADIMKLPSMKQAQVIGGHKGLHKAVYSITVLESVNPMNLVEGLFRKGEFYGSEIVITGFVNCPDDVELQCANLRRLAEGGEVGLILFYVGIFMKRVDPRLIALADELDFVLIQMPSTPDLRYGEVISDVTEAIYYDRVHAESIVSDMLTNISTLPEPQRTLENALQMLSDRLHASIFLTDSFIAILNRVTWPRGVEENFPMSTEALKKYHHLNRGEGAEIAPDTHLYHEMIHPDGGDFMHLYVLKEGPPIPPTVQEQVADTVRICANIWGQGHASLAIRELIRAIIQDEPIKMRRLSDVFRIDVRAIHDMWILDFEGKNTIDSATRFQSILQDALAECTDLQFGDWYEGQLLYFSSSPSSEKAAEQVWESVAQSIFTCQEKEWEENSSPTLVWSHGLQTTADVRETYLCSREYLPAAKKIFPMRSFFRNGDLQFAKECNRKIQDGEEALQPYGAIIHTLSNCSEEWNGADTMACHLLDNQGSIVRTAERMFLHRNTVKYRLKIMSDVLGFYPDRLPDSWRLYQALAIRRLMS